MDTSPLRHLMDRWVEAVEAMDLDGLLELYHTGAVIESPGGDRYSRDDLVDRLPLLGRLGRKMRLDTATVGDDGIETIWNGPRGPMRLWNGFQAADGRIRVHRIVRLTPEAPAPAAS